MSEPQDAPDLLSRAERAAAGGDLASADELLRAAARIQEAQYGPHHPDLANTLNNLAVVAEKAGRLDEAERCYRRAVSIAAASLPADDPMVMASRQNLEDFCRAHDLPLERKELEPVSPPVVKESAPPLAAPVPPPAAPIPPAPRSRPPLAVEPLPPVPARSSAVRSTIWIGTAAAVFLVLLVLVWRPWSAEPESAQPAADPTAAPEAAAPSTAPADSSPPPAPAPDRRGQPDVTANRRSAPPAPPGDISVAAQLCRDFSARGSRWRCTVAGNPAAPGPMVLYTRVKSPRNASVIHRWYRGSTLRQSVTLKIRANATDGYRTYSRQTVNPGEWRVEVATADGRLLDEQRFIVK